MRAALIIRSLQLLLLARGSLCSDELTTALSPVSTTSGLVVGHVAPNKTGVIEFLGVPFAGSTNGSQRWLPPQRFTSNLTFNASTYVTFPFPLLDSQLTFYRARKLPMNILTIKAYSQKELPR